jgi:hypothetical protein
MNPPAVPLVAAGLDWLEGILPLLFVLFWIISQIRGIFRTAQPPRPREKVVVRPPARPVANDPREDIQRQIEQFLRENANRGSARPSEARRPVENPAELRQRRPQRPPRRPPLPVPPPQPVAGTAPGGGPTRPAVEGRHLGALESRTSDIARHVQDAFAQDIGHLAPGLTRSARPADATPPIAAPPIAAPPIAAPTAAELAALLRNPASIRQLILAREILERPEHRW